MPVMDSATATRPARPADTNDMDLHYVEQTRSTLHVAMAASRVVSTRASRPEVRTLAREVLAAQTTQLGEISSCLREWEVAVPLGPYPDATALSELDGEALDAAYVEQLTAYAESAKEAARLEVERGENRRARRIAEVSIPAHCLQLAAVRRLARALA